MINDRRDEAISHCNDGVRDEYIKHFRDTHVADCTSRSACNEGDSWGTDSPVCFCRVGRFMHNLESLSSSCMSGLGPGPGSLLFHGQPL